MTLDKLEYVLAVAEEQNLTHAAARLFVSQPTLTLYLNRLEDSLGVKLFDRSKSPVLLTEAGRYYIEQMKKISDAERYLRNDLKIIAEPTHTLSIGIGQVRGHHWLPTILPILCGRHPELNINVMQGTETYMADCLHANRMDVAFGAMPVSLSDLCLEEIRDSEPLLLAVHQKYGLVPGEERARCDAAHPYRIEPEALQGLPMIAPDVNNGLYESFQALMANNGLHPQRTISINNMTTGLYLTVCGLGAQLIYASALQQNTVPDIDQLDFCILEKMPRNRRCVAAYRADSVKRALIDELIAIVREAVLPYLI